MWVKGRVLLGCLAGLAGGLLRGKAAAVDGVIIIQHLPSAHQCQAMPCIVSVLIYNNTPILVHAYDNDDVYKIQKGKSIAKQNKRRQDTIEFTCL